MTGIWDVHGHYLVGLSSFFFFLAKCLCVRTHGWHVHYCLIRQCQVASYSNVNTAAVHTSIDSSRSCSDEKYGSGTAGFIAQCSSTANSVWHVWIESWCLFQSSDLELC